MKRYRISNYFEEFFFQSESGLNILKESISFNLNKNSRQYDPYRLKLFYVDLLYLPHNQEKLILYDVDSCMALE